jgi:hypothetical protein
MMMRTWEEIERIIHCSLMTPTVIPDFGSKGFTVGDFHSDERHRKRNKQRFVTGENLQDAFDKWITANKLKDKF